jgi:nucleotide-binding universal stress UspA family protein
MEKKLLIAVDGSVYSTNTFHYLEQLFANLEDIRLHLLTIVTCTPSEVARDWLTEQELISALQPEGQRRYAKARRFLNNAVDRLDRNGIGKDQITTEVKVSTTNPAAEVLNTARKGMFDALVLGRHGLSKLEELIMGSVSNTMFEKCHDVPIWIVDGQVDSRKFLVPIDGSRFTLRAMDHLCYILQGNPYAEITLFHSDAIFARTQTLGDDFCQRFLSQDWCLAHSDDPDLYFKAPRQMLINCGFPTDRIYRLETTKGLHPSRQIVRQSLVDDFGTIVMGRRDQEIVKGVFGSVTEKVVAMSVDAAVWIVG